MRSRRTIVITGSGTVTCQSVIKALRSQDEIPVRVVTVDAAADVAGRYFSDEFELVPSASDPHYVDRLLEICRKYSADLLIPIVDYEFAPVSARRGEFAEIGCHAAISPLKVIEIANDKIQTHEFLEAHGFQSPRTWSAAEALDDVDQLPFPVFLKPALDGRSSIDCHVVTTADELKRLTARIPSAMVQELIQAPEYTADVLADSNSRVVGMVVRSRIQTKGGVSYKGQTVSDPEFEREVCRVVDCLGLEGPANIQAFRTDSTVVFIEVNPRFSGGFALSLASGFNSPLLLLKLALGQPVELNQRFKSGVTMLRYWNEVFVDSSGHSTFPAYRLEPEFETDVAEVA
jgi:carbamoyl-phosphate synthase large subunit